jgi:hypothetical protein
MPTELYNATDTLGMVGANESTILSQQGHMDRLQDCGNGIYGPEAITKVLTIPEGRRVRAEFVEMTTLLPTLDPIAVARIPTASSTALEIVVFLRVAMLEVPPDEQYGTPIRRPRNWRVHQIQQSEFPTVAPGLAAFATSAVARSEQQRAQGHASPAARGYSQSPGRGDAGHHASPAARYPQSAGRDAGHGTPERDARRDVSSGTSRTSGTNSERIFKLVWLVRIGLRNVNSCTSSRTSLWRLQWWRKRMNSNWKCWS